MRTTFFLIISSLLFTVISCNNDEELAQALATNQIDSRLVPFYERFIEEGNQRGIDVDLSNIPGSIRDIQTPGVAGTCQFTPGENILTVDLPTWLQSEESFREYIVFHELGHCFLERDHDNTTDGSNNCLSIMASGTTGCEITYGASTREEFLDELFGL